MAARRYVLCNSCKSPDTLLDRDSATRIMFLRCQQARALQFATQRAVSGSVIRGHPILVSVKSVAQREAHGTSVVSTWPRLTSAYARPHSVRRVADGGANQGRLCGAHVAAHQDRLAGLAHDALRLALEGMLWACCVQDSASMESCVPFLAH